MNNSAMNFDIKALLTLLLLKSGTSSRDIQTAVNLTAAARLMVAEEYAETAPIDEVATPEGGNVTKIRSARNADAVTTARNYDPQTDAMNSDIRRFVRDCCKARQRRSRIAALARLPPVSAQRHRCRSSWRRSVDRSFAPWSRRRRCGPSVSGDIATFRRRHLVDWCGFRVFFRDHQARGGSQIDRGLNVSGTGAGFEQQQGQQGLDVEIHRRVIHRRLPHI